MAQLVKNQLANVRDTKDVGLIPGLGRFPGEGNGNLLQYYCLENFMNRVACWATAHGVTKSWTWPWHSGSKSIGHKYISLSGLSILVN